MISESDVFTAFGVALGLAGAWGGGLVEMEEKGMGVRKGAQGGRTQTLISSGSGSVFMIPDNAH